MCIEAQPLQSGMDVSQPKTAPEQHISPASQSKKVYQQNFCFRIITRPYPFWLNNISERQNKQGKSWIIYKPWRIEKRVQQYHVYLWEAKNRPSQRPALPLNAAFVFILFFMEK